MMQGNYDDVPFLWRAKNVNKPIVLKTKQKAFLTSVMPFNCSSHSSNMFLCLRAMTAPPCFERAYIVIAGQY
jgi:hypothetical protein